MAKQTAAHSTIFGWGDASKSSAKEKFSSKFEELDSGTGGFFSFDITSLVDLILNPNGNFVDKNQFPFEPFSDVPSVGTSFDLLLQPFGSSTVNTDPPFDPINTEADEEDDHGIGKVLASRSGLNNDNEDHLKTFLIVGQSGAFSDNTVGDLVLAWEDRPISNPNNEDFNDWVFEITGAKPIPEPSTLLLLLIGIGGTAIYGYCRRRKAA